MDGDRRRVVKRVNVSHSLGRVGVFPSRVALDFLEGVVLDGQLVGGVVVTDFPVAEDDVVGDGVALVVLVVDRDGAGFIGGVNVGHGLGFIGELTGWIALDFLKGVARNGQLFGGVILAYHPLVEHDVVGDGVALVIAVVDRYAFSALSEDVGLDYGKLDDAVFIGA